MKKIIQMPAPIELVDKVNKRPTGESATFDSFVRMVLGGNAFSGVAGARLAAAIDDALDHATDGKVVLTAEQFGKLRGALDGELPFPPRALAQLLPFVDAIIGASDEK